MNPVRRVQRLAAAIPPDSCAFPIRAQEQLVAVLQVLGDERALRIVAPPKKKVA